eukprot:764778-Hanusia_phi.AAC.3
MRRDRTAEGRDGTRPRPTSAVNIPAGQDGENSACDCKLRREAAAALRNGDRIDQMQGEMKEGPAENSENASDAFQHLEVVHTKPEISLNASKQHSKTENNKER